MGPDELGGDARTLRARLAAAAGGAANNATSVFKDDNAMAFWSMADRSRDLRNVIRQTFSPVMAGQNLAFNPLSFTQTLTGSVGVLTQYREQFLQSRALMGPGAIDQGRLNTMKPTLEGIGYSAGDVLEVMQQLAAATGQVSANLDQSAKNITALSRATGINAQVFAQAFGAAGRGTALSRTPEFQQQMFQNAFQLAGGRREDMVMLPQIFAATEAFREVVRQSGSLPGTTQSDNRVQDAELMLARMQAVNPRLYRDRPDLAMEHGMQLSGMGRGVLLPFALDAAIRRGGTGADGKGPIDMLRVVADIDAMPEYMQKALGEAASKNPALMLGAVLRGQMSSGFAVRLADNPNAFSTGFTPDVSKIDSNFRTMNDVLRAGQGATSEYQRLQAAFRNENQDVNSVFAGAVDKFNAGVREFAAILPGGFKTMGATGGIASTAIGTAAGVGITELMANYLGAAGLTSMAAGGVGLAARAMPFAAGALTVGAVLGGGYLLSKGIDKAFGGGGSGAPAPDRTIAPMSSDATTVHSGRPSASRGAGRGTSATDALVPYMQTFVERMRAEGEKHGYSFRVTSTARDAERNAAVGGVANSLHLDSNPRAFDITSTPEGMKFFKDYAKKLGADDVLIHDTGSGEHLHIGSTTDPFKKSGVPGAGSDDLKRLLNMIEQSNFRSDSLNRLPVYGHSAGPRYHGSF